MELMLEKYQNKPILVTGGAGFVGSNLVDRLSRLGAQITVLDDLFTGDINNISSFAKINFIHGSVTDRDLVEKLVEDMEIVFHLAARNIIVSTKNPYEDLQVNVIGTFNVLEAARKHDVERMVYTSSASVYGNSRYLPINEDDPLNILNPYAASKLSGENYCNAFYETFRVPTTILRYSNVYGIKQSVKNPYCGVVSKFFYSAINGRPLQIHGDGEQTRDFTYIDDAVEATIFSAISPKSAGETLNVGTGREISINYLANTIIALIGKALKPVYIDRRDIDNLRRRVLNIEKIRKNLRWIPVTTLEKGLVKTYEWLSQCDRNQAIEQPPTVFSGAKSEEMNLPVNAE
jgi:UDP-glucose 4-epimerase